MNYIISQLSKGTEAMKYVGLALTIPFILNVGMAAALKYQDPLTN